jgi:histone H3/H4
LHFAFLATFAAADVCRLSRHGIVVPQLPRDLIRNLAQQFSSKPLSKDTFDAVERATDLFFQNVSADLATFARHAGRKVIEETDVQVLLQRYVPKRWACWANSSQRLVKTGAKMSVFSVAQRYLPGELLGRVRMVKGGVNKKRGGRKKKVREEDGEEGEVMEG